MVGSLVFAQLALLPIPNAASDYRRDRFCNFISRTLLRSEDNV